LKSLENIKLPPINTPPSTDENPYKLNIIAGNFDDQAMKIIPLN
jgi:hypothetical protein